MKILITSGGTTEKIDEVRSISNNSTGMLGKTIAESFALLDSTEKIYYICGLTALLPDTPKAEAIRIGSVAELEAEVKKVLSDDHIDAVIHGMAVSDYSVGKVTTSKLIGESICNCIADNGFGEVSGQNDNEIIEKAVLNSETLSNKSKISSDMDNLILVLQKTPKIIALFKQLAPEAILVGFKLLNDVSYDTLINTGYGVLTKNDCDFVLANDLKDIFGCQHIGYLIDKNKEVQKLTTKKEIADRLAAVVCRQTDTANNR